MHKNGINMWVKKRNFTLGSSRSNGRTDTMICRGSWTLEKLPSSNTHTNTLTTLNQKLNVKKCLTVIRWVSRQNQVFGLTSKSVQERKRRRRSGGRGCLLTENASFSSISSRRRRREGAYWVKIRLFRLVLQICSKILWPKIYMVISKFCIQKIG